MNRRSFFKTCVGLAGLACVCPTRLHNEIYKEVYGHPPVKYIRKGITCEIWNGYINRSEYLERWKDYYKHQWDV